LAENTEPNPLVSGPRHATSQTFTPEGLPLRQRQASLAPQLRETPPAPVREAARTAAGPDIADRPRPPEQRRSMLSSLQAGTNRGRLDATTGPEPAGETPAEPDEQKIPPAKEPTS
ncbi:MAG: hypothetical protein HOV83_03365, partial [Catenulispora sp.]|nr:hypothetical protein [Catenulispora sp.]